MPLPPTPISDDDEPFEDEEDPSEEEEQPSEEIGGVPVDSSPTPQIRLTTRIVRRLRRMTLLSRCHP